MIRTLIVDDVALARDGLRVWLEAEHDIQIVGEAGNGPDAVAAVAALHPHLMFLDIQLPGANGFRVIERIGGVHLPAVIFITAHDEYALRAFEINAVDYLLKPIRRERFQESLQRARRALANEQELEERHRRVSQLIQTREVPARPQYLRRFVIKNHEHFLLVKAGEVDWIEATGDYAELHTSGRTFLLRVPLHELESRLDPVQFSRIHRSTIVNLDRIAKISGQGHGDYIVTLHDGTTLRLSRRYRDHVLS